VIYVLAIALPPAAQLLRGHGVAAYCCGLTLLVTAGAAWPLCALWAVATVLADGRRSPVRVRSGARLLLIRRLR